MTKLWKGESFNLLDIFIMKIWSIFSLALQYHWLEYYYNALFEANTKALFWKAILIVFPFTFFMSGFVMNVM